MNKLRLIVIVTLFSFLYACGGGGSQDSAEDAATEQPTTEAEAPVEESPAEEIPAEVSLTIEANDQMQFSTDELQVTAGQKVTLTLKHTGQMAKEVMGHNWVLLKKGTEIAAFGAAAVTARDNGYIPKDKADQVIANTKIIGGGEETSITFDAPAPGTYKYICSFPGHYAVMQGSFVVASK